MTIYAQIIRAYERAAVPVKVAVWSAAVVIGVPLGIGAGVGAGDALIDPFAQALGSLGAAFGFAAAIAGGVWFLSDRPRGVAAGFGLFAGLGALEEFFEPDGRISRGIASGIAGFALLLVIALLAFAMLGAFVGRMVGAFLGTVVAIVLSLLAGVIVAVLSGGVSGIGAAAITEAVLQRRASVAAMHQTLPRARSAIAAGSLVPLHFMIHVPPSTQHDAAVFLAGSAREMGAWRPNGRRLVKEDRASYSIDLALPLGTWEFKLTRGTWATVEVDEEGSDIANRAVFVDREKNIEVVVSAWHDEASA